MSQLIQSKLGGNASGTVGALGNLTTTAVGFDNPTTAGNLIVCCVFAGIGGGGNPPSPGYHAPTISGGYSGSFVSGSSTAWTETGVGGLNGQLYYIADAPSMPTSSEVTFEVVNLYESSMSMSGEFILFEFSGVTYPLVFDLTSLGKYKAYRSGGTPSLTFSATTHTNLVISMLTADGSNLTAGSGFTLGSNCAVCTVGQVQYALSDPAGRTSAAFTGTETYWGISAMSFESADAVPTVLSVSPSSGPVAGNTATTITGTNFSGSPTVTFGGVSATNVVLVNSTTITCDTPANPAGFVTVAVTTSGGTGDLLDGFFYVSLSANPTSVLIFEHIYGFSPAMGDVNNEPTSQILTVTTNAPSFAVTSNVSWLTVTQLTSTTFQIALTPLCKGTPWGNIGFPQATSWPYKTPAPGWYDAIITVTAGTVSVEVPVTYGVG